MRHLAGAWLQATAAAGARDDVAGAGANLLSRWVEPHRRYHDAAHLDTVLRNVDLLTDDETGVVRLAAWFHDAVYDPTATDNEARSALLAEKVLTGLRVPVTLVSEVVRLVVLTSTHDPALGDEAGEVLSDADLAVLAGNDVAYDAYVSAVREEYGHLDDATFATGRAAVLRSLLDRPALFRTDHGRTAWEGAARHNVAAELRRLTSS
jgi:predicted metal-dependent HD superfamily phosphohydrolase